MYVCVPIRLEAGDVILISNSELMTHIAKLGTMSVVSLLLLSLLLLLLLLLLFLLVLLLPLLLLWLRLLF